MERVFGGTAGMSSGGTVGCIFRSAGTAKIVVAGGENGSVHDQPSSLTDHGSEGEGSVVGVAGRTGERIEDKTCNRSDRQSQRENQEYSQSEQSEEPCCLQVRELPTATQGVAQGQTLHDQYGKSQGPAQGRPGGESGDGCADEEQATVYVVDDADEREDDDYGQCIVEQQQSKGAKEEAGRDGGEGVDAGCGL